MGKSILTPDQKRLLEYISKDPKITDKFYLTGGTALAEFYLQHRLSEDLDFFSETEFDESLITAWAKKTAQFFKVKEVEYKVLRGQHTYYFPFPKETIKVDFAYFPFSHLGKFKSFGNLKISSILDIGVNKLQAILGRNRGRDYFDLYLIMKQEKLNLREMRKKYRLKFDVNISDEELAKACAEILDAHDMPRFLGKIDWKQVEVFFLDESNNLRKNILS